MLQGSFGETRPADSEAARVPFVAPHYVCCGGKDDGGYKRGCQDGRGEEEDGVEEEIDAKAYL